MKNSNNHHGTAGVTDNAQNMDAVVRKARLTPHIKCFAHTLNLASQADLFQLSAWSSEAHNSRLVFFPTTVQLPQLC